MRHWQGLGKNYTFVKKMNCNGIPPLETKRKHEYLWKNA